MKKYFFILASLLCMPIASNAQNVWEKPTVTKTETTQKTEKEPNKKNKSIDPKYLAGAVNETDGRVVWTLDTDVKGKSAQQIYDIMYKCLDDLVNSDNQLEGSNISVVNKQDHIIVARINEWLEFSKGLLALDRTKFAYTLIARCSDGHLNLTMSNLSYKYEENRGNKETYKAEDWITDRVALNKKGDKLYKGYARFRIKTIDRKDELFDIITKEATK